MFVCHIGSELRFYGCCHPCYILNKLNKTRKDFSSMASKPIYGHTDKSCIASFYRQFSMSIKIQIIKLINTQFCYPTVLRTLGVNKTGCYLVIFQFNICGKVSIIRCN